MKLRETAETEQQINRWTDRWMERWTSPKYPPCWCRSVHQLQRLNKNCTNAQISAGPNPLVRRRATHPDFSTLWKCVMREWPTLAGITVVHCACALCVCTCARASLPLTCVGSKQRKMVQQEKKDYSVEKRHMNKNVCSYLLKLEFSLDIWHKVELEGSSLRSRRVLLITHDQSATWGFMWLFIAQSHCLD